MQFVSLTRSLLLDLKCKGYNILKSNDAEDYRNPTWHPIYVRDVQEYLLQLNTNIRNIYLKEPAIMVIDDALRHVEDEQLGGEVFIEDDVRLRLEHKCKLYDLRYNFIANPEIYDFSIDPQRILIRNHALRTGDHNIYFEYLYLNYPQQVAEEKKDLENLTHSLICLEANQAQHWFKTHNVTMVESDIWICDEDAILKILAINEHNKNWNFSEDREEMIYNLMSPKELMQLREIFWIDPRLK